MSSRAVALLVVCVAVGDVRAQWLKAPTPGIPRTADGKPHPDLPKVFDATVAWLDAHLKGGAHRHKEQR